MKIDLRKYADYSFFDWNIKRGKRILPRPEEMIEVNGQLPELDIRSVDCSKLDLSGYNEDRITFDDKTVFPIDERKMPRNFNPSEIMEKQKKPGLGLRSLHQRGFRGKGLAVAIIDAPLSEHQEYINNLVSYKEFGYDDELSKSYSGEMHGAGVSSILVGKSCGVAPDAKLYYYSAQTMENEKRTAIYEVMALNDVLNLNSQLPDNEKIQAISISRGGMGNIGRTEHAEEWNLAVERAKKENVAVISADFALDYHMYIACLDRKNNLDPDDLNAYTPVYRFRNVQEQCALPINNRTLASPTSKSDYVHYSCAGVSWAIPFYTGLFLLARQADRCISLEEFHKKVLQTGFKTEDCSVVIAQPEKMIDTILSSKTQLQQQTASLIDKYRNLKGR